jgi:hypothetical protein
MDLVALAFLTGYVFHHNSQMLKHDSSGFYYTFDHNHNLVLDRSLVDACQNSLTYPKRVFQFLKVRSQLLTLISERAYLFNRQLLETRMEEAHGDEDAIRKDKRKSLSLYSDLNIYGDAA